MIKSDYGNHSLSKFRELVERLKFLVGVSSLGIATAILALSNRSRTRSRTADPSLGMIFIMLAGALGLFLTGYQSKDGSERRGGPRVNESVLIRDNEFPSRTG